MPRQMTEAEFDPLLAHMLGEQPANMDEDELYKRISVSQHITDLLLNEIERRGLLTFFDGDPIIPDYAPPTRSVATILTRP